MIIIFILCANYPNWSTQPNYKAKGRTFKIVKTDRRSVAVSKNDNIAADFPPTEPPTLPDSEEVRYKGVAVDGSTVRLIHSSKAQRLTDPWFDGPNVGWIYGSMDPTIAGSMVRLTQRWMDPIADIDSMVDRSSGLYITHSHGGQSSGAVWTGRRWTRALILDHQLPPSLISHTDSGDV